MLAVFSLGQKGDPGIAGTKGDKGDRGECFSLTATFRQVQCNTVIANLTY